MSAPLSAAALIGARRARSIRAVAVAAAFGAAAVTVVASWRAAHPVPLPGAVPPTKPAEDQPARPARPAAERSATGATSPAQRTRRADSSVTRMDPAATAPVATLLALNPFSADRRPPAVRFRMPGDEPPSAVGTPPAEAPPVRLIGTVVSASGRSFAVCQAGAEPARVVRVGERVGDLTLRAVRQGGAVFADAAGRAVTLTVPKAGG